MSWIRPFCRGSATIGMMPRAVKIGGFMIEKLLLYFDGAPPKLVRDSDDVRFKTSKSRQCLVELEQRTDVMFLVSHARRFMADLNQRGLKENKMLGLGWEETHRIGCYLTDIAKSDVLPAIIDVVSATTIRAEFVRGDEDGLGDAWLVSRIGTIRRYGGARGEMER